MTTAIVTGTQSLGNSGSKCTLSNPDLAGLGISCPCDRCANERAKKHQNALKIQMKLDQEREQYERDLIAWFARVTEAARRSRRVRDAMLDWLDVLEGRR
jgi:hypothetical protein